jgi:hypothetical protein
MRNKIPKKLLKSSYRKEMWKNVEKVVARIEKVLPISSMHLVGSFAAKKDDPQMWILLFCCIRQNIKKELVS